MAVMALIIVALSGALAGYIVPTLHPRLSMSASLGLLLGIIGGTLGGLGVWVAFAPAPRFDGLMVLIGSAFVYGGLMVVAAAAVRDLMRAR